MPLKLLLSALALIFAAHAGSLTLSKAFVEKIKNTAILDTNFRVDHILAKPHSISKGGNDGDIHSAGRDDTIRLPLVVEITNAKMPAQKPAMDAMKAASGGSSSIALSGIWRLWFEHAGKNPQIQGQTVPKPTSTNPDHVFEIHPITSAAGNTTLDSFQPIPGYAAYPAARAFKEYEKIKCQIRVTNTAIQIETPNAGFNHTAFRMHPLAKPVNGTAGAVFVLADIFDIDDEEERINRAPVRMVFLEGTPAAKALATLAPGERMNLLGIPRVDLNQVSALAQQLTPSKTFEGHLPYEIIIVGHMPEQ